MRNGYAPEADFGDSDAIAFEYAAYGFDATRADHIFYDEFLGQEEGLIIY